MEVRKFRHACLLVEESDARVLIDPGSFSPGWEDLRGLTTVLITHQHADHLDVDRIDDLLAGNPDATVYADQASAATLAERGHRAIGVSAGAHYDANGLSVEVLGEQHAVIHPDVPVIPNAGYLLGGRLFHPGDALTVPERRVEILALPATAPWMKVAETIDYLRAVAPRVAIPIHEAVSAVPQLYYGMLERLGPDDTTLAVLDDGKPREF